MPGQCLVPARAGVHTGILYTAPLTEIVPARLYIVQHGTGSAQDGSSETPATFGQQQLKRRTAGC